MPLGETHPDRRHTCLPSHRAHIHTHHLVHTPGLGSHWDDSCKLWRQGLSLVEKEGEGKEEMCVCGGGTRVCTCILSGEHNHSRRHPMRGSQKEGVAPEGGQLVHAVHRGTKREMLRRLTLHKHPLEICNMLAYQCNFWR